MKHMFFYLTLIYISTLAYSQASLFDKSIDWKKYEESYSAEYKRGEIKKIKDDLLEYLEGSGSLENNLINFHFIDYNFDGVLDIIYSGDAGTEIKRTLIFELGEDGYYSKTFDKFGHLISLYSTNIGLPPYSLILKEEACCGGTSIVYENYQPVNLNGKLELQASTKFSSIVSTYFPAYFFDQPVLFEVKIELYCLRLNPTVDNETSNEELHINGNIIAEYTTGSKGYAIAEKQDETGRVWWFVLMINNNKPQKSIFDVGSNNENKYYSLGWMSSRYLEKLSK